MALKIISKVSILYSKLNRDSQTKLLHEMVKRVIVNTEGTILRMEQLPPFSYLDELKNNMGGNNTIIEGKTKTSQKTGQCSRLLSLGSSYGFQHTSLPSLKASVHGLLKTLSPTPNSYSTPINYLKNEKTDRSQKIIQRHQDGDTLAEITDDFGISIARVHQLISKQHS